MASNNVYVQGNYVDVHDIMEVHLTIDKGTVTIQGQKGEAGSNDAPRELPLELGTDRAMVYWKRLREAGWVDEQWQRTEKMSLTAAAFTVNCFAVRLNLEGGWAMFEQFWGCKNLCQAFNKMQYCIPKKCEELKKVFDL